MAEPRECARCGKVKRIAGRGLCSPCYQFLQDSGGLKDYPTRSENGKWIEIRLNADGVEIKQCTRCKEWKPLDGFYKSNQQKDGYESWCKSCRIEKSRGRYAPIKQEVKRNRHSQYRNGLKQCKACQQWKPPTQFYKNCYHWDGLSHICDRCKAARAKPRRHKQIRNPQWAKEWYQKNREKSLAASKRWAQQHPDKSRIRCHRYKARKLNAIGDFTADQWKALKEYYSPDSRCLCCGEKKGLTQDHVIPLSKRGTNLIDNIQPICQSCNSKKGNRLETDYRPDGGIFARSLMLDESLNVATP